MYKVIEYRTIGHAHVVFTGDYGQCQAYVNGKLTTVDSHYNIVKI